MGSHSRPYKDPNVTAIDRKREKERRYMLQTLYKNADEIATRLVQKLLDKHIIETTAEGEIREVFRKLFEKLPDMDEFDVQFKIAPIRQLAVNPNFISLYLTQYITEDLINHGKIQDIFGDDQEIYQVVDSIISAVRPR